MKTELPRIEPEHKPIKYYVDGKMVCFAEWMIAVSLLNPVEYEEVLRAFDKTN